MLQALQLEELQDSFNTKVADVKEATADYEERLTSLSSELSKAAQRIQQHAAKLQLIKQVQACPHRQICFGCIAAQAGLLHSLQRLVHGSVATICGCCECPRPTINSKSMVVSVRCDSLSWP